MKVRIDDERCKGHGMCCTLCPRVFELIDAGYAVVRVEAVQAEDYDRVRAAVDQCPEHAISISE